MAIETNVNAPSLVRNVLDIPDDTIIYDPISDHPASFLKKVVSQAAAPNSFRTRKEFYGKFLTVLDGAAETPCLFDPVLSAMKSNGEDTATDAGLFVCLVWVQELSSIACPQKDDWESYKRIADNGGVFKSYFYAGNRAMEFGEDVLISFLDPATRKEGVFIGPLKGGAPQGIAGAGGVGGGPGGGAGGAGGAAGGGFSGSPSSFSFKCDNALLAWLKELVPECVKKAYESGKKYVNEKLEAGKKAIGKAKSFVKSLWGSKGKNDGAAAKVKKELKKQPPKAAPPPDCDPNVQSCPAATVTKVVKGQSPNVKKEGLKPDGNCPKPFGDLGKFKRVIDARAATYANAARTGKPKIVKALRKGRKFSDKKMKKCVAIIFHQTAIPTYSRPTHPIAKGVGGRKRAWPGMTSDRKAGGTSVHIWCNPDASIWWYDLNVWLGTSHNFNRMPTIGIEINHHAEGVLGSPAKSKGAGGRSMTHYVPANKPGKTRYRGNNLWYGVKKPTTYPMRRQIPQILDSSHRETLRQTVKFICSYLQQRWGTRVIYIGTHRNSFKGKPSCPGDFAIRAVGAPLMKELGLHPWPDGAPTTVVAGGHKLRLGGKGSPMPEAFFAGTQLASKFEGIQYSGKSRAYTAGNWNARPTSKGTLTWQEAMKMAGTYRGNRGGPPVNGWL